MNKLPITLIVLTKDEEQNLEHCLKSSAEKVAQVIVVDSGSTDGTLSIARRYGADIYEHPFKNQADQFNWALDNADIQSEWILRLDADEVVYEDLWREMAAAVEDAPPDVTGFYMKRRVYFMGRWIRYGGYYPTWLLRLFRKGKARSEERDMDEHLILSSGRAVNLENDFKDENHKDLSWWIAKHNDYSSREAQVMFDMEKSGTRKTLQGDIFGDQPERRRWVKEKFYFRLPIFLRPLAYFFARYFLRGGFLDGKEGFLFHFMQGLWYRLLVDAKYYALKRETRHPR
jgi:glycosyltransferase involved in cell wall biosynthesis